MFTPYSLQTLPLVTRAEVGEKSLGGSELVTPSEWITREIIPGVEEVLSGFDQYGHGSAMSLIAFHNNTLYSVDTDLLELLSLEPGYLNLITSIAENAFIESVFHHRVKDMSPYLYPTLFPSESNMTTDLWGYGFPERALSLVLVNRGISFDTWISQLSAEWSEQLQGLLYFGGIRINHNRPELISSSGSLSSPLRKDLEELARLGLASSRADPSDEYLRHVGLQFALSTRVFTLSHSLGLTIPTGFHDVPAVIGLFQNGVHRPPELYSQLPAMTAQILTTPNITHPMELINQRHLYFRLAQIVHGSPSV